MISKKGKEYFIIGLIRLATYLVVAIVGYILFDIFIKGFPILNW